MIGLSSLAANIVRYRCRFEAESAGVVSLVVVVWLAVVGLSRRTSLFGIDVALCGDVVGVDVVDGDGFFGEAPCKELDSSRKDPKILSS